MSSWKSALALSGGFIDSCEAATHDAGIAESWFECETSTFYDREAATEGVAAAYADAAAASRPFSCGAYLGCLMNLGTES